MSRTTQEGTDSVIPPSSFFIFWPGDEPPTAEEIRVRLQDWGQAVPEGDFSAEETVWSFWFELADRPISYLVWCEQVTGPHLVLLDSVRWRSEEQKRQARDCQWVVGLEGAISLKHPTADYQFQLKLCEAIGRDWAPVFYDASAFLFRTAQDMEHLIDTRTPPRTSSLYNVHRVRSRRGERAESTYWVHTHGLERAGVPDLEIFDVPESLLTPATELIEAVADLWIEFSTPDPQFPFAVGRGLEIAWRPWQAVVAEAAPRAVGGWSYRDPNLGHAGYRAVLVSDQQQGWMRRRWQAPLDVLRKLTLAETTLYKTTNETRRMALLARERWGTFGLLFAGRHPSEWRFAVKLNYPMDDDPGHGEHLWFEVKQIKPGRIYATLVSNPSLARGLEIGTTEWHDLDRLSDWRILTPERAFDPETADTLLEEPHELPV